MLAIEVSVNGRRVCVAGLPVGTVTASVATVNRQPRRQIRQGRSHPARSAYLTVSGYTTTATDHEFPWWVPTTTPRLRIGDSVILRIVDVRRPDKPRTRRRQAKRPLEHYEHREYLRLKAKYAKRRGV